jgi:tetratricopeptide (TPR) repeat protein
LPSEERVLLQIASVIGREIPVPLLQTVAEVRPDRLAHQLLELRTQEFLHEVPGSFGAEYTFKHALTQAVAYDSMLVRHRRKLHGLVLTAIENMFAGRLEEFIERMADHALRGEVWEKASLYSLLAGQRANHRSAHRAATVFFRHALDAQAHLPEGSHLANRAIDIRLGLRLALFATGDLELVRGYLREAENLARSINDVRRLMPIVISHASILTNLGELDEAVAMGSDGRALAEQLNDEACLVSSGFTLGQAYWNRGEFTRAHWILSSTVGAAIIDRRKRHNVTTGTGSLMCLVLLSHTHSLTGQFKDAFSLGREALELAAEIERPYDLSYAHAGQGLAHLTIGELDEAIQHLQEASRIARTHEIMLLLPHAARYLGRAYTLAGRLEDAERVLVPAVHQTREQSLAPLWGWCSATLGLVRALNGAFEEATVLIGEALDFAHKKGYRALEAYALRQKGILCAKADSCTSSFDQTERWFRCAAKLAQDIGMQPELAHCHHGLGDMFIQAGRPTEARAELAAALELYRAMGMLRDSERSGISLRALEGTNGAKDRRATSGVDTS